MLSADGVLDGEQRDRSQWHGGDNPGGPQKSRIGGAVCWISPMAFALCRRMLHTLHADRYTGKFIHHHCPLSQQKGQRSNNTSPYLSVLIYNEITRICFGVFWVTWLIWIYLFLNLHWNYQSFIKVSNSRFSMEILILTRVSLMSSSWFIIFEGFNDLFL